MADFDRSTVRLTHFGRKSGKPYRVTIWFVVIDGRVWIGSMSRERSWVKNVQATKTAELDFGSGPRPVKCEWRDDRADLARFSEAVKSKHPLMSRVIALISKDDRCTFRTDLTTDRRAV